MKNKKYLFLFLFVLILTALINFYLKKQSPVSKKNLTSYVRTESNKSSYPSLPIKKPVDLVHQSLQGPKTKTITTKKLRPLKPSDNNALTLTDLKNKRTIKNVIYPMLLDYYACELEGCFDKNFLWKDKFHAVFKGPLKDSFLEPSTLALFIDENNRNKVGIWNKQIMITTKTKFHYDLEENVENLNIEKVQQLLPTLFMVKYNGELDQLEKTIEKIKSIPFVQDVSLDIMFERRK